MVKHWLTFGMSAFDTPGFQDTSRLMHAAFPGPRMYIEPPQPFSGWLHASASPFRYRVAKVGDEVVLSPPLPFPRRFDVLRIGASIQARFLDRVVTAAWGKDWRSTSIVYLTNWSYAARPIVEHLRPKYLLFDCVDDVLAFPYEVQQERVNAAMAWLARRATVVTAVSSPLAEKIARDWHIDAVVLPNGVDAGRFRCPTSTLAWCTRNHRCEVQSTVLTQLVALRKSVPGKIWAGFAGTLNHWIDYDAMRALVDAFPDIHLVLIGKVGHLGSASVEQSFRALQRHPSVSFLGPVSYDALPACLHALDILLLTRVPGPASLASSPLKFYEYLAVGKPVVVCGVPVPEDARALVYSFPEGKRGLLDAVRLAVGECRGVSASLRIQRQAYAASHSWETRVEAARACLTAAAGC